MLTRKFNFDLLNRPFARSLQAFMAPMFFPLEISGADIIVSSWLSSSGVPGNFNFARILRCVVYDLRLSSGNDVSGNTLSNLNRMRK